MMMGDRMFFIAMILIPLLITVMSGYAFRYVKLGAIPVAAVDEDCSEYSVLLLVRLSKKEGLKINIVNREKGMEMLEDSGVEQVFAIREGFGEAVQKGKSEGLIDLVSSPYSYSSGYIKEVVAAEVTRMMMSNSAANNVARQYRDLGIDKGSIIRDEAARYADSLWEPEPLMTIEYRELKAGSITAGVPSAVPGPAAPSAGLITAFIMFYMLFGSGWLVEERVNGTIKRLSAGKGAVEASFGGSILAMASAGLLQMLLFYAIQKVFFDISLFRGIMDFLVLFTYLFTVIAISLFLSSVLKTPVQLQAGAPIVALFAGFAGGCFWNFIDMPRIIDRISLLTPQGWVLRGINAILQNPSDYAAALQSLLVLSGTALILLFVSYMILNIQLRRG